MIKLAMPFFLILGTLFLTITLPVAAQSGSQNRTAVSHYTVASGDNYLTIAKKFDVQVKDLMVANGNQPLAPGQQINVPVARSVTPQKSTNIKPAKGFSNLDEFTLAQLEKFARLSKRGMEQELESRGYMDINYDTTTAQIAYLFDFIEPAPQITVVKKDNLRCIFYDFGADHVYKSLKQSLSAARYTAIEPISTTSQEYRCKEYLIRLNYKKKNSSGELLYQLALYANIYP